jgi:hypothetical protein
MTRDLLQHREQRGGFWQRIRSDRLDHRTGTEQGSAKDERKDGNPKPGRLVETRRRRRARPLKTRRGRRFSRFNSFHWGFLGMKQVG